MLRLIESISAEFDPKETDCFGLRSIDMRKLGATVLLAGPNGGGKTRLLKLLKDSLTGQRAAPAFRAGLRLSGERQVRVISVPSQIAASGAPASELMLTNVAGVREGFRRGVAENLMNMGNVRQTVTMLLHDFLDADSPAVALKLPAAEISRRKSEWLRLEENLRRTMGVELGFDPVSKIPTIDGRYLDKAFGFFSDGQKKLFGFIVGMTPSDDRGDVDVVLIDEPETYLHPAASIELLQGLQRLLSSGQLWVATHSPIVLAALGWENVWWAEGGRVSYAGRHTRKIVDGLIGGSENSLRLRALLSEPDKSAFAHFMYQCLCEPPTASLALEDPQFDDVANAVNASSGGPVRVLDWGAQQGRFAYWLAGQDETMRGSIDYYAYDISSEHADVCRKNIEALCGTVEGRYAIGHEDLAALIASGGRFDAIVLCNVLHEIPPTEWPKLMQSASSALANNGRLLLAEDLELPIGELPTTFGFILLTKDACGALFEDSEAGIKYSTPSDKAYNGRLVCYDIPARLLSQVSLDSVRSALALVRQHSLRRLKEMRKQSDRAYRAGNLQALHFAQYGNVALALEGLDG